LTRPAALHEMLAPKDHKGSLVIDALSVARARCARVASFAPLLLGLLMLGTVPAAQAQWAPNESLVSPNRGLIDFEVSQQRGRIAWTDSRGDMWLGRINRKTGAFEPWTGRGQLLAQGTVSGWNMFMWNGPEWVGSAQGDQIFYSYYLPGLPKVAANTRMAVTTPDASGAWVSRTLSPDLARMSHIASKNLGDTTPHIKYLDPELNQYVRDLDNPGSEQLLDFIPPSNKSWRLASGMRALMYAVPVGGTQQVVRYLFDSRTHEQLTFDGGQKDIGRTVPWLWQAPEFGGDFVLATVADESQLRIYRQLAGAGAFAPIYSASVPAGSRIGSPEWFTYNGKSYVFMAVYVGANEYASEIWLSNIDAADPIMRRITDSTLPRARNDPEVFITEQFGPLIYYNRYDPSIDPAHPLCADCSEGVYRADPGLLGR
jgi:hypothetical protein